MGGTDAPATEGAGGGRRRARRHPLHRRRRLRSTALLLGTVAVVGTALGLLIARWRRPAEHRPGEELPEITRKLSRQLPEEAPWPRFVDVTAAAGLADFRTFAGPRTSQLPEDMGSGAAWGDFDGDGDDDLFLVAAGGDLDRPESWAPSRLYENLGDGTFRPAAGFPELGIVGMGAAWGDVDGDGQLELAVSGYRTLLLFHREGEKWVADPDFPHPDGYWAGITFGDFDNDRDLDLYVCGYVRYDANAGARRASEQYGQAVPFTLNPASFAPEPNLLLVNDGGRFVDRAVELGVADPEGRSLSALWHDFDDDGWLDLYVANDISDNVLYLNRGGTFEDASHAAWVADYRGAMGLTAGDWNRDGDDDLFITHWIAQENALYDSLLVDGGGAAPTADGSPARAVEAVPALAFSDRAAPLGLGQTALRFVGWGTEFADFDGDGWLDLAVANGSTFETEDVPPRLKPQEPLLLWNQHGTFFHDLAPLNDALAVPHVGRGLAVADYDGDGDLDLLIVHHGEGVQLLRNDMQRGHWLELELKSRGVSGEPSGRGEGARVVVRAGGVGVRRAVTGASYLSQSSRTVHFGLGETEGVEAVEVRWLGGGTDVYQGLTADAVWELTEGDPVARQVRAAVPGDPRQRAAAFWKVQREAMAALQRDGDPARAASLFRQALALDPRHEDARYYLANALAMLGREEEALVELDRLRRQNPQSHRAFQRWGALRARTATSAADLAAAEASLEQALALNPEETGSLQLLGEIALLRGDDATAAERLAWVSRTHPRSVGAFFLRAYLAWKGGDVAEARRLLVAARQARGPEWKPEGAAAEGDTARRFHEDDTPLTPWWRRWDGDDDPATALAALAAHLERPLGDRG